MGVSTDGIICFGIEIEEDEAPWQEDYEEIDDWWLDVNNFQNPFRNPYDESGEHDNWIKEKYPNMTDRQISDTEEVENFFDAKRKWQKENPIPVDLVWHCSYDYPMFILAVKGTKINASRGYPRRFSLKNISAEEIKTLTDFCKKYKIEFEEEPSWILCSMWG